MPENTNVDSLVSSLTALIASADDAILRDISRYDNHGGGGVTYEEACDLHFNGLKDLIGNHNSRADWSKHYWYPLEAVELRAHSPDRGDSESFAVAILILLLDDIEDGGRDHMEERCSERFLKRYEALPKEFSQIILDGLKLLRET